MQRLLLGVTLTALCNVSYSCYSPPVKIAELNGQPIVRILSENAKFLLEMHPARWLEKNKERWSPQNDKFTITKESLGIVYRVAEDGLMTPIWEVEGTYPQGFKKGMFPYHPERYTFYVSNDGSKIIRVIDKHTNSKSLISIYDQSGSLKKITYASIFMMKIKNLRFVHHCGGSKPFQSHYLRAEDILEFQPLQRAKASETLEISIHTGELRKQPN